MGKVARARRLTVCLLSPHPLVYDEFQRLLHPSKFRLLFKQFDSALATALPDVVIPSAPVYVLDAELPRPTVPALIQKILENNPAARLLVIAQKHTESGSFSLLRLGVKGLLTYADANQLAKALPLVAAGGFWVPRPVLARFVDSILGEGGRHWLTAGTARNLSRREQQVFEALLENLANKEIAQRLNISERTVKFHVSNLLAKFSVRRRADLILLCFQRQPSPP